MNIDSLGCSVSPRKASFFHLGLALPLDRESRPNYIGKIGFAVVLVLLVLEKRGSGESFCSFRSLW